MSVYRGRDWFRFSPIPRCGNTFWMVLFEGDEVCPLDYHELYLF